MVITDGNIEFKIGFFLLLFELKTHRAAAAEEDVK